MDNINDNINNISKSKLSNEEKIKLLATLKSDYKRVKLTPEEIKIRNRINASIYYYKNRERILLRKREIYNMAPPPLEEELKKYENQ